MRDIQKILSKYEVGKNYYLLECGHYKMPDSEKVILSPENKIFCSEECYGAYLADYHGYDLLEIRPEE